MTNDKQPVDKPEQDGEEPSISFLDAMINGYISFQQLPAGTFLGTDGKVHEFPKEIEDDV
tara:strand:+ start:12920 stop:13099 length:180 start_codon:yes stop_codon:yes gene_type:complete